MFKFRFCVHLKMETEVENLSFRKMSNNIGRHCVEMWFVANLRAEEKKHLHRMLNNPLVQITS